MKYIPSVLCLHFLGLSFAMAADIPLPEIPKSAPTIFLLPSSEEKTTTPPTFVQGTVFFGDLLENNAEEIRVTPDGMLVLRIAGYQEGHATLSWEWPERTTPAGLYQLWTLYSQGGSDRQEFVVSAGPTGSQMEKRLVFSQSARSWEMVWRKAKEELLLLPNDQILTIQITGKATQQKQFAGFLLVRVGDLPPGLSEKGARAAEAVKPKSLVGNAPVEWLTVGTWAGPAGLSLWGLDYESKVHPFPGAREPIRWFDHGEMGNWKESKPDANGRVIIQKLLSSFTWAKGAGYAHVYLYSPKAARVTLHLGYTGTELQGWLNGRALDWLSDPSSAVFRIAEAEQKEETVIDRNDQGGLMEVKVHSGATSQAVELDLTEGWNRLLIKPITRQVEGDEFAFGARFTSEEKGVLEGMKTSLWNPWPCRVSRAVASRFVPSVRTNAPFNLVHERESLSIDVQIGDLDKLANLHRPLAEPLSEKFQLELVVTDYDGKEIARQSQPFRLPGSVTFDLGKAPARGYYATHLRLLDEDGNSVTEYPSDGFSVIGGVAAQEARKHEKKMAVTYYFMSGKHKTLFFPYMKRIGIFRNIGGTNARDKEFYRYAADEGILLSADMWSHRDGEYIRSYVEETAPYVDSFKAFNEIDIHRDVRGTPEAWVKKAKQEYEIIKQINPKAVMAGGSLIRPASDDWFKECLKLGLANYHDVWDVHCYPQKPPVLGGSMSNSPNETELGVQKTYKDLGLENDKPFWIGETGARCSHGFDARRWQAEMVAKMTACTLSRKDFQRIGFLVPWWYSRERGSLGDIEAGHMPAEAAYYTASALIDGFPYELVKATSSVQIARFGPTLMAWYTEGPSRSLKLYPVGPGPFVQVDVVGRVKDITADKSGAVEVTVGESPIYVLSRANYDQLTAFEK